MMMMKSRMMNILRVAARLANHQLVANVETEPNQRERRWNVVRICFPSTRGTGYIIYCMYLTQSMLIIITRVSGKASLCVHDDSSDDETKASKSSKKITKASAKSAVSTKKKSATLCNKNPFVAKAARQMEEAQAAEMSTAAAKKKPKGTKKAMKVPKSRKDDIEFEEDVDDEATVLDSSDDEESGKQNCIELVSETLINVCSKIIPPPYLGRYFHLLQ